MSQLILSWLNDEVCLSRKIVSLKDDFKDGYLLGELLYKYNQQLNFDKFSPKGTPDAKINNFCLLEGSMRQVGVNFNSAIASDIMNCRETTLKNLLYAVKTALERIKRNTKQSGAANGDKLLSVINPSKPLYDKTMSITFENAVRTMIENPNEILMANATKRFKEHKNEFRSKIETGHADMMNTIKSDLQRYKEIEKNRKDHAGEFVEAWESINLEQWKTNQKIARDRKNLKKNVELKVASRKAHQKQAYQMTTRDETFASIDDFDHRVDNGLILTSTNDHHHSSHKAKNETFIKTISKGDHANVKDVPDLMYIDQTMLNTGLLNAQNKMKEHHEESLIRQQKHDRRRRKFTRECDTMQSKLSQKFFEDDVATQLLNYAICEKNENFAKDNVVNYKSIIAENRANRQMLFDQMKDADTLRDIEWQKVEADRENDWIIQGAINSQFERKQMLSNATNAANTQQAIETVQETLNKILDLTDWIISCRSLGIYYQDMQNIANKSATEIENINDATINVQGCGNAKIIPDSVWSDAISMFISSNGVSLSLPEPTAIRTSNALKPFCISERPLCVKPEWLFEKPFTSSSVMVPQDASDEKSIAKFLATSDTSNFIVDVNNTDKSEIKTEATVSESRPVSGKQANTTTAAATAATTDNLIIGATDKPKEYLHTPEWINNIQSKYFLGESIIAIRTAFDPLPEDPEPKVNTSHVPLRAAICGLSEVSRHALAVALQNKIINLTVLKTSVLLQQAYQDHIFAQSQVSVDPPVPAVVEEVQTTAPVVNNEPNEIVSQVAQEDQQQQDVDPSYTGNDSVGATPAVPPVIVEEEYVDYEEIEKKRKETEDYRVLCEKIHTYLLSGLYITDDIYVDLLVNRIKQIPEKNNGFVIEDFPNTKQQAILLMEALSGINYGTRKAQNIDKASDFALNVPRNEVLHDISKCGLDLIINVNNEITLTNINNTLDERIKARYSINAGGIEYIQPGQASIVGLVPLNKLAPSQQTSGIELTLENKAKLELLTFFEQFKLVDEFYVNDYESLDIAVDDKSNQIRDKYIAAERLTYEFFMDPVEPVEEEEEEVLDESAPPVVNENNDENKQEGVIGDTLQLGQNDTTVQVAAQNTVDGSNVNNNNESNKEATEEQIPVDTTPEVIIKQFNSIHPRLAKSLNTIWEVAEKQSKERSDDFFNAFRDIRYQMIQRRRGSFDCLSYLLVRLDGRQELFDNFRKQFNELDSDLRFDPDCIMELHLQTLELGDSIFKLCTQRKVEAEEYVTQISSDALVNVAIHRCRCEAVSFAQAELNRFYIALHVLFDFSKAIKGYDPRYRIMNEVEVTLPITLPSTDNAAAGGKNAKDAKGKEKDTKKGKDAGKSTITPFREPVGPVVLPAAGMQVIPEPKPTEPVDPKAKSKGKDKKGGGEEVSTNPFDDIYKSITEEMNKWAKGTFAVNRELYQNEETLCATIEQAVWFEANKVLISINKIQDILNNQTKWLEENETSMVSILNDMITKRYLKELSATKLLLSIIESVIESANPLEELWLVTPDAASVNPEAVWDKYYNYLPAHRQTRGHAVDLSCLKSSDANSAALPDELIDTLADVIEATENVINADKERSRPSSSRHLSLTLDHHNQQHLHHHTTSGEFLLHPGSGSGSGSHGHNTPHHVGSRPHSAHHATSAEQEHYRKEVEKYQTTRKVFETKLTEKREQREQEYRSMGMSPSTAKLAAYNELILDEQHQLEDFDSHHKPHPNRPRTGNTPTHESHHNNNPRNVSAQRRVLKRSLDPLPP